MKQQPYALSVRRQKLTIAICVLTYTALYLCKYGFNANITLIEADYGISHATTGLVVSLFSLGYAAGQVVNGLLCRFYSRRFTVPLVLCVSAGINLTVFFHCPFSLVRVLWFVNALCLSVVWPMVLQVYSENIHADLMPKAMTWLSVTTGSGTLITYGLSSLLAGCGVYRWLFFIGPAVLFCDALFWIFAYAPGNYAVSKASADRETTLKKKAGAAVWIPVGVMCLFGLLNNATRDGVQTWVPAILKEVHGLPDSFSILLAVVLPLFGMFGAMISLRLSRVIRRFLTLILCFFAVTLGLNLLVVFAYESLPVMLVAFGILELVTHGVSEAVTALVPLSMRGKISSGLLGGLMNGCGYLGSAVSSFLLGKIADVSGWTAVFAALLATSAAALTVGGVYWLATARHKEMRL